jgi:PHD/YefM family antitoxin component YafN of YafNO toxin-antitoxin module
MKRITAAQAQNDLDKVIQEAAAAHEPVGIDGQHAQGVLVSLAHWNAIQESLYLFSVPGMLESTREGAAESFDSCSETPDW